MITARLVGLEQTIANLGELGKATGRNVLRRTLMVAATPLADTAARLAPHESGRLGFSIAASTQLTGRQRRGSPKASEAEVYVGPAGGVGALMYASFVEFGTVNTRPEPYLRPAWESTRQEVLNIVTTELRTQVERAAARAARKVARLAAG